MLEVKVFTLYPDLYPGPLNTGIYKKAQEKKIWKDEETTNNWKKNNLKIILTRLKGWQLESFKESYEYKVSHGLSLYKKELNKD